MKIAMPTDDRKTLAAHFGRAAEFAVYEVADGEAKRLEHRPNLHVGHAAAQHGRGQQAAPRGRGGFEESLAGVDALICKGMGRRAEEACAALGIDVIFATEVDLDDVAGKFARGELAEGEPSCERGEGHHA
jgi:predicted Fe-Mo cluster-binding NifX family protein